MALFVTWLFTSRYGRALLVTAILALGIGVSWWFFSRHYDKIGYERCQEEHQVAQAEADRKQAEENARRDAQASEISKAASEQAAAGVKAADTDNTTTKGKINDIYKAPAATQPVAAGSCVHPVDERVQGLIDQAVDQANSPGGSM